MQTILGAGGAIGVDLAKALTRFTTEIRIVSRNPKPVNETDEVFAADLTRREDVLAAIKGSKIVYVVVGFPYNLKVWQETWPAFIHNVIDGCKQNSAKLVFFDNIYMLDEGCLGNITEESPINPPSRKGKVRAEIDQLIINAYRLGEIRALIARAADFYGPGIRNSVVQETVLKNLMKGKAANWLISLQYKHSMTFTPDAAIGTALLGNADDAYNQVWNLPTAADPPTGQQWVEAFARELGVKPKTMVAKKYMLRLMGLFNSVMAEIPEMAYQHDRDYVFNSSKFEKRFSFTPTPYEEGIRKVVEAAKKEAT